MKRVLTLTLTLALLALGITACSSDESKAATETTATTATSTADAPALPTDVADVAAINTAAVETVATTTVNANTFEATGEFISPVRSELSPKLPGRVSKMFVDEGTRVQRGQPVLVLESDYARINLQAAEAELARAKAVRDEAERDLARKQELLGKSSIPKATFDRSKAAFEQATAAHAGANAQVALLRQQVADSTMRSPVDGIIAEKRTEVGARLGDAGVAFVIVQLSPLKLRFPVPERLLGKIAVGDRVTARVEPYAGETFEGSIKTIGGVIDPKTRTMFAEAEFANRDGRLRPGLFARVETKLD
ncbi:MAG TPA: efflux RND transporter periplasmic adaptor subunit [Thermoanaerobaculia bacterium]|jgi:membrane fusion protein (multidrug efflux system)|nr:efflux RND transporter periplasmic adaptor subunit [Thermoanaerobaculia bacterium]